MTTSVEKGDFVVEPIPNIPEQVWPSVASLKGELKRILEMFMFEKNDNITRQHAENMIRAWLSFKHKNGLIGDYFVRCDPTNNHSEVLAANKLVLDVAVQFIYREGLMGDTKTTSFVFIPLAISSV